MVDSKENNKFDLEVKGLGQGYIKFLELKLQNGVAVRIIWSENLGLKGLRKNISHIISLTPKICLLILPSSCYTFPCK